MKYLTIFLFYSVMAFGQKNIYVIVDDGKSFNANDKEAKLDIFRATLSITTGDDRDFYDFNVNAPEIESSSITKHLSTATFLNIEDLKKKSPCDLHYYLSSIRTFILQRDDGSTTSLWGMTYYGTVRNIVRTSP